MVLLLLCLYINADQVPGCYFRDYPITYSVPTTYSVPITYSAPIIYSVYYTHCSVTKMSQSVVLFRSFAIETSFLREYSKSSLYKKTGTAGK